MTDACAADPPSPFVERWSTRLSTSFPKRRRALDVAVGRGRHARVLARSGYDVIGIDVRFDAVRRAKLDAAETGLRVAVICADLTTWPLPRDRFELIVVSRYLQRDLFPALRDALVPGGVMLYETFTDSQLQYDRGPRSRNHLLKPGELRMRLRGMDVLFDEEVTSGGDALARIAARRRST